MSVKHEISIPVVPYVDGERLVLMPRDDRSFFATGPLQAELKKVATPLPARWRDAVRAMGGTSPTSQCVASFPEFMRYLADGTPPYRSIFGEYFNTELVMHALLIVATLEGSQPGTVRLERATGMGVSGPTEILRICSELAFGCVAQLRLDASDEAGTPWPAPPEAS